jgi:hypothetical protein
MAPVGLRALGEELAAVVERHRDDARHLAEAPGAVTVHVQMQTFPRHGRAG